MSHRIGMLCLVGFVTLASRSFAAQPDVEGGHDHPAIKRYPGSYMTETVSREFEALKLPIADDPEGNVKSKNVEGRFSHNIYRIPKGVSCTQVNRNYENAFKAGGLTVYKGVKTPIDDFGWGEGGWTSGEGRINGKGPMMYLMASCDVQDDDGPWNHLMVVQEEDMAQKVEIDAVAMAEELEKTGRISLYGINFSTGKADITPESSKTLEQIGQLLASKPEWKLRIEGHTDNVGKSPANLALSKKRAAAVRDHLIKNAKVTPARLTSEGFGDTKPLAPNTSDEGRAKNRRVELSKL